MKHSLKKILTLLLAAALLLSLLAGCGKSEADAQTPAQGGGSQAGQNDNQSSSSEEDFEVSVADRSCIHRYNGNASVVVVPEKIHGVTIEKIGRMAFNDNNSVKKIILPDTVTEIESHGISSCDSLEEIELGKGLKQLDSFAIANCEALRSIHLPEGFERLDNAAFLGCTNLEELYIPASTTHFGGNISFLVDTPRLTVVTPEGSMAAIIAAEDELPTRTPEGKEIVFDVIPVLERAYSVKDLGDGTCMIWKIVTKSTVLEIPEKIDGLTVVQLGNYGEDVSHLHIFQETPNVERVVLPDTVHTVGNGAFQYCPAKEIDLGQGLKRVGEDAFFHAKVESIRFPEGTESLNCPFQFTDNIREAYIPASVTEIIGDIAENCQNLTVVVPAGSYAAKFISEQKYLDYQYRIES